MIPKSCLLIESKKFPVLPGEDQEITNEHMYGKALCQHLQSELPLVGINVPTYCSEDWGWWLDVERGNFKMGLCIYSDPGATGDPERYALLPSIHKAKKWSWAKFKKVDLSKDVLGVIDIVERVLKSDKGIPVVSRHDDYPFD
ncbi:hypothetical protein [Massilia sp. BSC265]|uniref:hypothetical protein n=1 Tax=Massilia sp. BSC265 TaxID=1549812 RepID=UPI001269CC80|nr:hypothetical protein [Massilia sp. BSC265]